MAAGTLILGAERGPCLTAAEKRGAETGEVPEHRQGAAPPSLFSQQKRYETVQKSGNLIATGSGANGQIQPAFLSKTDHNTQDNFFLWNKTPSEPLNCSIFLQDKIKAS